MKVIRINECGSTNLLEWCITHGANVKTDQAVRGLINDETYFEVIIGNVNMLELFRFAQIYRDKLWIQAEMPTNSVKMDQTFDGSFKDEESGTEISYASIVKEVVDQFSGLVMQMKQDPESIPTEIAEMFMPMYMRRFQISIPMRFADVMNLLSDDEAAEYMKDRNEFLDACVSKESADGHPTFAQYLNISMDKMGEAIRYPKAFDDCLSKVKYQALSTWKAKTIYKLALDGFCKFNPGTHQDIRCTMFQNTKEIMTDVMKEMQTCDTPLRANFVIQLPIAMMLKLANHYSPDVLPMYYDSSMVDIISRALPIDPIRLTNDKTVHFDMFQVRIAEIGKAAINGIGMLLEHMSIPEPSPICALLPSIYSANAVIQVSMEQMPKFLKDTDPSLRMMFESINEMMNGLQENIKNVK